VKGVLSSAANPKPANAILTKAAARKACPLNRLKRKAIFLLYRVLTTLALPAIAVYLALRCLRNRRYLRTIPERLGELPALWQKTSPGVIWLHAVSVGEVLAALPLIEELRQRAPNTELYLSTATLAGREMAEKRLTQLTAGIFFAPLDFAWAVRKVLRRLRPSLVVVLETEIWPNLFRETRRIGAGLMIVNGRISDKALPSYEKHRWLFSQILPLCDRILTQSELMSERFVAAGASPETLMSAGNLKYDFKPGALVPDSPVLGFLAARADAPVWIAASTSADDKGYEEEDAILTAQQHLPGWRLILAPRKPERFDRVAGKIEAKGLSFTRRSSFTNPAADILLLDSIGELSASFAHATVVFMGGTLAERGGHNVLEPAIFGKPIICGPHLENFRDIEAHFEAHQALLRIADCSALKDAVLAASHAPELGTRARAAAEAQQGTAERIATAVLDLHTSRYPVDRPQQPKWFFLWCFAQIWALFSARDRRSKRSRVRHLPIPVISIGNITAGGTGKTPVAIDLLQAFDSPALLTRGYGRSTSDTIVIPAGDRTLPTALTGDETQLYMRRSGVPVGIGGERYAAGQKLLTIAQPRVFVLDDGFQHLQLHRDFDLVLIDSLHPFGGGHLIPLGRLREPMEGLGRADAFLITRANEGTNLEAIAHELRRYNPIAPVFRTRTMPLRWVNHAGDFMSPGEPASATSIAICGLGNPNTFWKTMEQHGVMPRERYSYGDHHRYTPIELRRLTRRAVDIGVTTILTTEKDAVNLPAEVHSIIHPLQLWWLEIGIEIDHRDDLLALIRKNCKNV